MLYKTLPSGQARFTRRRQADSDRDACTRSRERWHRGAFMGDHLDPAKLDAHLDRMLQHLYVEVDATDAQKQQLGPIVKAAARDLLPMRDRMRDARLQAVALLSQPSIDRAALEALRAELDQPSVWPRGHAKRRRLQWSWGTVRYRQSWGPSGRNPIIADDPRGGVGRETIREDPSGGAGTHDHVVVHGRPPEWQPTSPLTACRRHCIRGHHLRRYSPRRVRCRGRKPSAPGWRGDGPIQRGDTSPADASRGDARLASASLADASRTRLSAAEAGPADPGAAGA